MEFISRYIAHGTPSKDTMDTYRKLIDQFIAWCGANGRHPLAITNYPMHVYREALYNKNYQNDTIRSHLVAIRSFYHAAKMLNLVKANPCANLDAPSAGKSGRTARSRPSSFPPRTTTISNGSAASGFAGS